MVLKMSRSSLISTLCSISPFHDICYRTMKSLLVHCQRQLAPQLRRRHSESMPYLSTMIHVIGDSMLRSSRTCCCRPVVSSAPSLRKMGTRPCRTMATSRTASHRFTSPIPISYGHQNILFPDWVRGVFVKHSKESGLQ